MANIQKNIEEIRKNIPDNVKLIVVTKMHSVEELEQVYNCGERVFGENRVQEICFKQPLLPSDIEWHLIGSLQTNKVKMITPFVTMIHSVDSARLLETINKEAAKCGRVIDILMELYIATEESKHGWSEEELIQYLRTDMFGSLKNIRFKGVMGMASLTEDMELVRSQFRNLKSIFDNLKREHNAIDTISMGMSGDYKIAIEEGSTMVRIGSAVFKN